MKIFAEDGLCFVDMEHSLTINEVEAFKHEITPLLTSNKEFLIHCIDVVDMDSAGLQILISLKKYLEEKKIIFEVSAGIKFKEMISFYRLESYFQEAIV